VRTGKRGVWWQRAVCSWWPSVRRGKRGGWACGWRRCSWRRHDQGGGVQMAGAACVREAEARADGRGHLGCLTRLRARYVRPLSRDTYALSLALRTLATLSQLVSLFPSSLHRRSFVRILSLHDANTAPPKGGGETLQGMWGSCGCGSGVLYALEYGQVYSVWKGHKGTSGGCGFRRRGDVGVSPRGHAGPCGPRHRAGRGCYGCMRVCVCVCARACVRMRVCVLVCALGD